MSKYDDAVQYLALAGKIEEAHRALVEAEKQLHAARRERDAVAHRLCGQMKDNESFIVGNKVITNLGSRLNTSELA